MRIVVLLGLVVLIAGCGSETFDVSSGKSHLVEAKHRAILSVKRSVFGSEGQPVLDDRGRPVASVSVCAEPSPDALQSTALALGGKASAKALEALLGASYVRSETQAYVGLRTQTIQLLRDAYFRLCEAFMNDGIDAIAYDVLQRRFQSQIVALLAVEQLTGAVVAGKRDAGESPAAQLARIANALEESEKTLRDLVQERDKAKNHLSELKAKRDTENDEEKKKLLEAEVEAAGEALEAVKEQVQRRQRVVGLLKDAFAIAAQRTASGNAAEPAKASTGASGRSDDTDVAHAVRAITLNAINQDYESQVCFETLRYHNHLAQFRNDVNNAFDSGGILAGLAEGTFIDHCRDLFASQADFRNARVSAVEAFAAAIGDVTSKIGTGKLTADEAASYIRALAESVPSEPGVAFLPHDPKRTSMASTVGSKVKVRGNFTGNALIEGNGTVESRDSNRIGTAR